MNVGLLASFLATSAVLINPAAANPAGSDKDKDYAGRADRILKSTPLIDGHNDLPFFIRKKTKNQIYDGKLPFDKKLSGHTDLKRLRNGKLGGQFWSVYIPCGSEDWPIDDPHWAVRDTLEQIDVTRRLIDEYSDDLQYCDTARCAKKAFKRGKIASFMGIEGAHQIGNSLGNLRRVFDLGVRYITVTHNCDNAFATAQSTVAAGREDKGLTDDFGPELIKEMNRLGMLVDLSHVSHNTMRDTLKVTKAPVIFSHSSAYGVAKHLRNVPDDVLKSVAKKDGVVMVTFVPSFVKPKDPKSADIEDVVDHIFHIAKVAGWDHVGIGGDYDGTDFLPKGLEDVTGYPRLIAAVLKRGASNEEARKLAGENILRVWDKVEKVAKGLQASGVKPNEEFWQGRNWTEASLAKRFEVHSAEKRAPKASKYDEFCD